nr:TcR CD3 delta-chain [Sus scrofa]
MEHSRFLSGLILAAFLSRVSPYEVEMEELEDKVFVSCNTSIIWLQGTEGELLSDKKIDLGKRILDPRGLYKCNAPKEQDSNSKIFLVPELRGAGLSYPGRHHCHRHHRHSAPRFGSLLLCWTRDGKVL